MGCRPLRLGEFNDMLVLAEDTLHPLRARRANAIFMVMYCSGLRINETVTLHRGDVSVGGRVANALYLRRSHAKGKPRSTSIPLHDFARRELELWFRVAAFPTDDMEGWVFPRVTPEPEPRLMYGEHVSCQSIRATIRLLAGQLGLEPKVSCHSFRKAFAERIYEASGHDLIKTGAALRHEDIGSTLAYLDVKQRDIGELIVKQF
jgi:integrase